jgi:hypothetical protein
VRFPFSVKLIFGIGEVTTPGKQAKPLVKLYLASVPEETAPFPGSSTDSDGCMHGDAANANASQALSLRSSEANRNLCDGRAMVSVDSCIPKTAQGGVPDWAGCSASFVATERMNGRMLRIDSAKRESTATKPR